MENKPITPEQVKLYDFKCEYCGNNEQLEFANNHRGDTVIRCSDVDKCSKYEFAHSPPEEDDD
jgi:alpha-D-ribose 1-methylphosphonate 5-phosphate C-P lyase